jgi:hypothetical protein
MLVEMGYDAFAVDLFGAGERPETTEARVATTRGVLGDPKRLRALMAAGLEEARRHSGAERAVTGCCFGGTVAPAFARTGEAEGVEGWASRPRLQRLRRRELSGAGGPAVLGAVRPVSGGAARRGRRKLTIILPAAPARQGAPPERWGGASLA